MKAFNQLGGRIKNSNFDFKDEIQSSNWGRRYDHKFRRFLPIFGEKIGVFLPTQCYYPNWGAAVAQRQNGGMRK
jgi:hypothetical protein